MFENSEQGLLELARKSDIYFKENELVSVEGLCEHLGITRKTLNKWQHTRGEAWAFVIEYIKDKILAIKKQNAYKGLISYKSISFDLANNYDYEPVSIKELKEKAKDTKSIQRENNQNSIDDIINNLEK